MSSLGLNRKQIVILAALALLDCLVIAGLGTVIIPSLTSAPPPTPQAIAEAGTATPTATRPPPPPTWTPRPTATPAGWKPLYTFDPHECPFEIPEEAGVECGSVILPERRDHPDADQVHLEVSLYSGEGIPEAPPFVYLSGGPGGAAVEDLSQTYEWFIEPRLVHRDVIIFDQRGTGLSEPNLECFEYVQAAESDLEKEFSTAERAEAYPRAMRRCRNRLVTRGVDPAAYTSAANAADVRDLVEIMGYEQAVLYGASYGSRLALTVMRDYPEVVHSAILDGVEPIEADMYNGYAAGIDRLLNRLFDGCAADAACRRTYPNLEAEYEALVEQLNAAPVEVWTKRVGGKMYRVRVDGDRLTGTIFYSAYSTEMITFLPRMIRDTAQGDYELLSWMLGATISPKIEHSIGMYFSVNCHEEVFATTPEELAADYESYPYAEGFVEEVIFGTPETLFNVCEVWGAAPFDPLEGQPVESDIPTLVLVGEYDPVTPPPYARQVAEALDKVYAYEFPGQGHVVGLGQSPCAMEMVEDFLEDPTVPPDDTCMAEMGGPDFVR